MSRRLVVVAAAIAVVAILVSVRWSAPAPEGAAERQPLNVVLVTIDTLRDDRVGGGLTPHLDRLVSRGRRIPDVRATAPLTLPSHTSLMTGTIPPVHGVRENGVVFDRQRPTLARIFRAAGYRTGAFVGAYVLNRRFGLDDGFEVYDDAVAREAMRAEMLEAERRGSEVIDAALAWLEGGRSAATPFFLWVHLYDPHAPYDAPPSAEGTRRDGYDGEVAYADAQVGRLLAALEAPGVGGRTVIAVTSDHGESLGEHGEATHGMLLYDGALRVPLILAGPGVPPDAVIGCHHHLGPALLRLAGLADRLAPGMADGRLDAESGGRCAAYSETLYPRRAGWHGLTALTDGAWKMILSSERELYELSADPRETTNLADARGRMADGMAATLAGLQSARESAPPMAPEAADKLRALGYVGGTTAPPAPTGDAPNPARVIEAWVSFERALALIAAGRPHDAVAPLAALSRTHPDAWLFHATYARARQDAGDAQGALRIYRDAVARWPSEASLYHDLAVAARAAGEVDEAARAEQAAIALDGNSAVAHNGLGLLHAEAGRHGEAVEAFTRATAIDPGNAWYWTNLGNAQAAAGDATAAEAAYRRAVAIGDDFADALNGLGTLAVQRGQAAAAVPLFERALRRDPALHEARLNLGIALQESGQPERAAAVYRDLLATAPSTAGRERQAAAELLKSLR